MPDMKPALKSLVFGVVYFAFIPLVESWIQRIQSLHY